MQRDELGLGVEIVDRFHPLDAELAEALLGDNGVEGDDTHPETGGLAGDLLTDLAEPDHANRLAGQLDALPLRALPFTLLQGRIGLRNVADQSQE